MARDAYAKAGVELSKVRSIQALMGRAFSRTLAGRRGVGRSLLESGHYAGMIEMGGDLALTLHVDGVGTKVIVAQLAEKYDTVGIDCVAMTVNDLICLGSEPVALLDYLAMQREDVALAKEISRGLLAGARQAHVAIVGGETAILGDIIKGPTGNGFDLASMGVGFVKKDEVIDGSKIVEGDRVVGLESSGLHSNGYTLARKVVLSKHRIDEELQGLGRTLGEELLIPTSIYVDAVLATLKRADVHGLAHITGGAFSKLTRLAKNRAISFRLKKWPDPPIFEVLRREGRISDRELYRTFNMGVGFCVVAPASEVDAVVKACRKTHVKAFEVGRISAGRGVFIERLKIE